MDPNTHALERRLRSLETRLTIATAVAVGALACLGACAAMSAHDVECGVLRARSIELVDGKGRVRMQLAAELDSPEISGIRIEDPSHAATLALSVGTMSNVPGALLYLESDPTAGDGFGNATLVSQGGECGLQLAVDDERTLVLHASRAGTLLGFNREQRVDHDDDKVDRSELETTPLLAIEEKHGTAEIRVQDGQGVTLFKAP